MLLNIDDTRAATAISPWLRLAFRPFFLGGAAFSALAMGWWVYYLLHPSGWRPYGGPVWWHGHEMIFGFAAAIVVGFLLTAVQTWTNVIGMRGRPLALLWLTWLAGRLLLASEVVPRSLAAGVDLLFLPAAAVALAIPVLRVRQWRNVPFVPILLLLAALNGLSHWAVINGHPELASRALFAAVMLVVLLVAIIGGRVIPMFTANGTGTPRVTPVRWLEWSSLASLALVAAVGIVGVERLPGALLLALLTVAAISNGWRFVRWGFWHCWRIPLLWSLHLAYAFLPLGLAAMALQTTGLIAAGPGAVLHFFTTGAIGGMILAMIARVSLGHTGRPLHPPRPMVAAFVLIACAALLRAILAGWFPALALWGYGLSGACWTLAYALFLYCYGPMLISPRADGRPG